MEEQYKLSVKTWITWCAVSPLAVAIIVTIGQRYLILAIILGIALFSMALFCVSGAPIRLKYNKLLKQGKYIMGNKCPHCRSKMYWKDLDDTKEWCRSCGK